MKRALVCVLVVLGSGAAATEIPVSDLQQWTSLSYRGIPATTVAVVGGSLLHLGQQVGQSAGLQARRAAGGYVIGGQSALVG